MQHIESLGYTVYFEEGLDSLQSFVQERTYSHILILVDRNTNDHCLPLLQAALPEILDYDIIEIDPGEENKNIDFCIGVWKTMLDFGADRNALMINLGGGVVTDMGGFAASTYKRGIDFIHIPTTLLAQVDASVGGKTGIDMDAIKNSVGTFAQPQAVYISNRFLETLDQRQLVSGFAEVIKHGLIQDKSLYQRCKEQTDLADFPQDLVYDSVVIKNKVVCMDPKEKGLRKILNFGHTIGHAVEAYSLVHDEDPLLHGEAIAIGMICEAYLSHQLMGLTEDELHEVTRYILDVYPYYELPGNPEESLLPYMYNDKKNEGRQIGFALLESIGSCTPSVFVEEDRILESLRYYRDLQAPSINGTPSLEGK